MDLTQEALAERAGCSVEMIKKLEAGRARPSRQLAELLATALELPAADRAAFVQAGRAGDPGAGPAAPPPAWAAGSLPASLTALIGREHERAAATALLRPPGPRLVTFTGPGGTGKTRLAIQVAADLRAAFPDGTWFVALAAITDPALVLPAIAGALGLRETAGQAPQDQLLDYLRAKRILLLLDNFEQVAAAAAAVAALSVAAPGLTLLITSRAVLRVRGEHEFPVPPLALPGPAGARPVDTFAAYAAVRLFVERARQVRPGFALSAENAAAVAAICRRLDGLPLAIELAAAWVKILPPAQLLARLAGRLGLLTGGPDLPARQQTLQATIDWSYNLLTPAEQSLFRRLAVFAGGWTLEAAEAVGAGDPGAGAPPDADVLTGLLQLANSSLVVAEERDGEARYRFLETIRQYAQEKLEAAGEAEAAHARHRDWCLRFAAAAVSYLHGAEQLAWLERLEAEHDNLRAALDWCLGEPGGAQAGLHLAGTLSEFWIMRSYLSEGRRRLGAALARPGAEAPTAARARALHSLSRLMVLQGDFGPAQAPAEESIALWRALGDPLKLAEALDGWQELLHAQGNGPQAEPVEEAIRLYRQAGDARARVRATLLTGWLAEERGDRETHRAALDENIRFYREVGDRSALALALSSRGWIAQVEGDYAQAMRLGEEALANMRALNDRSGIIDLTGALAFLARTMGDYTRAAALYAEALALARDLGSRGWIAGLLTGLADLARDEHDPARATQLYTESLALDRELGDKHNAAWALRALGFLAQDAGANERAAELYGQSLAILQETGAANEIAWLQRDLGQVALQQGDLARAAALFHTSLATLQPLNNALGIVRGLLGLGAVATEQGQPLGAARLFAAAGAMLGRMQIRLDAVDQASYTRALERARLGADPAAWDAAWAAGGALTPDEACALARATIAPPPTPFPSGAGADSAPASGSARPPGPRKLARPHKRLR